MKKTNDKHKKAQAQTHPIHACHMYGSILVDVRSTERVLAAAVQPMSMPPITSPWQHPKLPVAQRPGSPPARARCHSVRGHSSPQQPSSDPLQRPLPAGSCPVPQRWPGKAKYLGGTCAASPSASAQLEAPTPTPTRCVPSRARSCFSFLGLFFQIVSARLNTASSQPWSLLTPSQHWKPTSVQSTIAVTLFSFFTPTLFQSFPFRHSPFRSTKDYKKNKNRKKENQSCSFAIVYC